MPRIHHSCRSHPRRADTPFWGYAELASYTLAILAPRRPFTSSRTPTAGTSSSAISGLTRPDALLGENLARFIEDARVVVAIPEVQSDRSFFNSRFFCFHTAGVYAPAFLFLLVGLQGLMSSKSSALRAPCQYRATPTTFAASSTRSTIRCGFRINSRINGSSNSGTTQEQLGQTEEMRPVPSSSQSKRDRVSLPPRDDRVRRRERYP